MRWLLLLTLLALTADADDRAGRFDRFCRQRSDRGLPCDGYAFFEAFPASGAGTTTACSTTAPSSVGTAAVAMTFTRASVAECYSTDGQTITQLAVDKPRVMSGDITDPVLGFLRETNAQNDLLQARDFSSASWTKTNMTCVHTTPGMRGGDVNGASTCTATGANATVCQTITTAAATRVTSGHIKRVTGSGAVTLARDGVTFSGDISASLSTTVWRRAVPNQTIGCLGGNCIVIAGLTSGIANPQICIKLATSGDAVALDFWQDEANSYPAGAIATTPIATTTEAVPRAAELGYFFGVSPSTVATGSMAVTVILPSGGTANNKGLMSQNLSAVTKQLIYPISTGLTAAWMASGNRTSQATASGGSHRFAMYWDASLTALIYDGVTTTGAAVAGTIPNNIEFGGYSADNTTTQDGVYKRGCVDTSTSRCL